MSTLHLDTTVPTYLYRRQKGSSLIPPLRFRAGDDRRYRVLPIIIYIYITAIIRR